MKASVNDIADSGYRVLMKGAPEIVFNRLQYMFQYFYVYFNQSKSFFTTLIKCEKKNA